MEELKEPEITLFGRKIVLPENGGVVTAGEESSDEINGGDGDCDLCLELSDGGEGEGERADDEKQLPSNEEVQVVENSEIKQQETDQNPNVIEESKNPVFSSEFHSNPKTPSIVSENNPKSENEHANEKQKTLKKPDKILPCPRCNSMDTKFCYYNNYNVNQPRHFCKSCQRYWTAGGTMRNVPVGAGRRKNKNSASHCHLITISEALEAARVVDSPNGYHHLSNGTILSFGPGPTSPLCESASALDLPDKRAQNGAGNGNHKNGEKNNDSSVTTPSLGPEQPVINNNSNINGFMFPVPCVPWNFPWNSAVPLPAICPVPFYPTPYWNYNIPNTWNFPCVAPQSSNADEKATAGSGPGSLLGKHSRNGESINPSSSENKEKVDLKNSESSIVVPKTLRIDDPEEAAKSSIWETLGIKYDSISREGLFKALQPKGNKEKLKISASPALKANPAALSRSISFQEGA